MYEVRLFNYSRDRIRIAFYFHYFHSSAVPVENAASSSIETRVAPDGIAYSWTEFENYFDADMAAEIWEAAQVVAPPEPAQTLTSPSFRLSSLSLLHASSFLDPMLLLLLLLLLFLSIFIYSHCYMYTHSSPYLSNR